jgi:hypothetical protein
MSLDKCGKSDLVMEHLPREKITRNNFEDQAILYDLLHQEFSKREFQNQIKNNMTYSDTFCKFN